MHSCFHCTAQWLNTNPSCDSVLNSYDYSGKLPNSILKLLREFIEYKPIKGFQKIKMNDLLGEICFIGFKASYPFPIIVWIKVHKKGQTIFIFTVISRVAEVTRRAFAEKFGLGRKCQPLTYAILSGYWDLSRFMLFWKTLSKHSVFGGQNQCFLGITIAWCILHIILN